MKKSIITSLALVLVAVGSAKAAVYSVTNNTGGAAATPIVNSTGNQLSGVVVAGGSGAGAYSTALGVAAIGYFTTLDLSLSTLDKAGILGAFQQFGAATVFPNTASALFQRGLVTAQASGTVTGTEFSAKNIYLLVGSGATTLAGATEFLILKTSTLFTDSQDASGTPLSVPVSGTAAGQIPQLLLGGYDNFQTRHSVADSTTTPAWNTVAPVPEPSAAMLGLLAGLGLIARRRRA